MKKGKSKKKVHRGWPLSYYILVALAAVGTWWLWRATHRPPAPVTSVVPGDRSVRLTVTGDIVIDDILNIRGRRDDGSYDYLQYMGAMVPLLKRGDVRVCQQSVSAAGTLYGITGSPDYNASGELISDVAELGCNVVSTASRHALDKGDAAAVTTLEGLNRQERMLAIVGTNRTVTEQQAIRYFTVKDVKFAVFSYTMSSNRVASDYVLDVYNKEVVAARVAEAKKHADVVLMNLDWSHRSDGLPDEQQQMVAADMAVMGVDIVLGHGTSAVQPVQKIKRTDGRETVVWYSLGNFLSAQESIEAMTGCLGYLDIDKVSKRVTSIGCTPTYMHYEWTLEQKARRELAKRNTFLLVPLDAATMLMSRSQYGTTVQAQTERMTKVLNTYTTVNILSSK